MYQRLRSDGISLLISSDEIRDVSPPSVWLRPTVKLQPPSAPRDLLSRVSYRARVDPFQQPEPAGVSNSGQPGLAPAFHR